MDPDTLRKLAQGFIASLGEAKDAGGIIVRRPVIVRADSIDEKARSVRMRCSSEAVDSYDDVVKQNFRLERYRKNPVVLYGHNRVGVFGAGGAPEWTLPIGYSTDIEIVENCLEVTMNFVDGKASPMAPLVWQGFLQGSIRASSIGFYPHEVTEEQDPETGNYLYTLDDNELFEISVVPIGANPDAVALNAQRKHEKAWFHTRALSLRAPTNPPPSPAPAPTETKDPAAPAAPEQNTMTDEEKKALEDAKTKAATAEAKATEEKARADKAEAELKALKDAGTAAAIESEVRALVGVKITENQVASFIALRTSSPESFKAIVDGLPALPEASDEQIEKDVGDLVGKKILVAQKADFVALRKLSPELFATLTKGMPELPHTKSTLPAEKEPTKNKAAKRGGTSKIAANAVAAGEKARGDDDEAAA